jgi:serine-type D-Ala-D-Ala carboxypeptidase/endopeptidase (penicillin-binding protein 4)
VHLRSRLNRVLRLAGPATGAEVYDLTAGATLYGVRDGVGRAPASVEKLYTTVAALRMLGSGARLRTTVLGAGHLGPGGVWHGDLYLKGGGDPTFGDGTFNKVWELGYGPTASQLANQLTDRGIRGVTGSVIGDGSIFDAARGGPATDFRPDLPDYGGQLSGLTYDHGANVGASSPEAFAAKQLAATLRAAHVNATAAPVAGTAPRRTRRLAIVSSPPLSVLISLMNIPSDDLFAELLTKQLGWRFAHEGSIAAGARVISREIAAYGLHPEIVDGSGLSREDHSSPREVVALLQRVWHTSVGHMLSNSLPVLGVNGTTRRIGKGTFAQGRCIAKTGTLNYVTNLAGYCHSADGHMLAFALFLDGPSNEQAIGLLTRMVGPIARY